MPTVLRQDWMESERGWGTRPDGHSLHLTEADAQKFIEEYWSGMPATAPEEYSKPIGKLNVTEVDDSTYNEVRASRNGIRRYT